MIQRRLNGLRGWGVLAAALIGLMMPPVVSAQPRQQRPSGAQPPRAGARVDTTVRRAAYPEQFFLHAGFGGGLAILNSSAMNRELQAQFPERWKITNAGIDLAFLLRVGYKNIAQAEYRIEKGFGHKMYHDINPYERQEVEANIDSREWLLKVNPVYPWIADKSMGVYLLYGQGTAEYVADVAAFEDGEKKLYGIEFLKLYRWYGFSLSVEYHDVTFREFQKERELPIRGEWGGSYWIVQASVSVGYGE